MSSSIVPATASVARPYNQRVDYLKFIVPMDYDRAQEVMPAIIVSLENVSVRKHIGPKWFKHTVLGGTQAEPTKSRHVLEAWGPHCIELAYHVPMWFWEHLGRIDWRAELMHTQYNMLESYVQQMAMSPKLRRNITTFNTKSRQKTNTRDVGGRGVCIGSRKSDSHMVAYWRADELPAVELRFQGGKAAAIGANLIHRFHDGNLTTPELDLLNLLDYPVRTEMYAAAKAADVAQLEQNIRKAHAQMSKVQLALDFVAPDEAQAYEESTDLEEQERDQRERWLPSDLLKGPPVK